LLGFFIGPFSFILFWILPILLTGYSLIPEALILIFLTAIPITFSIAIVKYHLMDIHLLVRRSLVYSVILALIIITYIGLSSLITLFVQNVNPAFPTIITAIAVVALLQPVKNVIQKFVDKKFFRVEYDYREEQKRFLEDIKNSLDIRTLAEELVIHTDALIPLDSIGFFILRQSDSRIKLIANKGWDLLEGRSIRFESENLKTDLSLPIAMDDRVEPGLNIESADLKVFKRWGIVLVFPVKSPTGDVHAFLALGAKKSGTRYLKDDVDLLNTVVAAAALAVDRITLQEELILEHLEAERLKELDEMRTEFINTMTHELKTPLTNIKLFTQLTVLNIESTSPKAKENLRIIDGESDKLQGLIENILDYAKIEKGMMMYEIKKIEITEILKKSVDSVLYQFSIKKQTLENNISDQQAYIYADAAAVDRAIINLLTNASKYSSINSKTIISTELNEDYFIISIKDSGRGIPSEELNNVFKPFIRVNEKTANKTKGTGLGLAIVKHIMDAHNGKIDVQSEVGKGSIFTLWFPVIKDV
ncbi:MAG: ATP-binding protein, partial [Ignavibacteriaceae bacterium]|nr:ATP-binding protein [Ignavibacteriaceae bacterium]